MQDIRQHTLWNHCLGHNKQLNRHLRVSWNEAHYSLFLLWVVVWLAALKHGGEVKPHRLLEQWLMQKLSIFPHQAWLVTLAQLSCWAQAETDGSVVWQCVGEELYSMLSRTQSWEHMHETDQSEHHSIISQSKHQPANPLRDCPHGHAWAQTTAFPALEFCTIWFSVRFSGSCHVAIQTQDAGTGAWASQACCLLWERASWVQLAQHQAGQKFSTHEIWMSSVHLAAWRSVWMLITLAQPLRVDTSQ